MTGLHAIITIALIIPTVMFAGKFLLRRAGRTVIHNHPLVVMPPYPPPPAYPPLHYPVNTTPSYPPYPVTPPPAPHPHYPMPFSQSLTPPPIPERPMTDDEKFDAIVEDFYTP